MSAPWDIGDDWTTHPGRRRTNHTLDDGLGPLMARVIEWNRALTPRNDNDTVRV